MSPLIPSRSALESSGARGAEVRSAEVPKDLRMNRTRRNRLRRLSLIVSLSALALAGCASPGATSAAPDSGPGHATHVQDVVTVSDAWVKAADEGMTAGFGIIANHGDTALTLVSASSTAAEMIELHETVSSGGQMAMQEVEGGFSIPAGGELVLEPGGDHLMFMGLPAPLRAGEEAAITLRFSDGTTLEVVAPVKDFSGANESYAPGSGEEEHGSHSGHGQ